MFPLHANSHKWNVYGTQNDRKKKVEPKCLKEEAHVASTTPMDSQQVLPQF